jgi:hypothetical protein
LLIIVSIFSTLIIFLVVLIVTLVKKNENFEDTTTMESCYNHQCYCI